MHKINLHGKNILVTGAAGFIGAALSLRLLNDGLSVTGIDNMNDYYPVSLKEYRFKALKAHENFRFIHGDISDIETVRGIFEESRPSVVVNLAAQAGVRYSITNPGAYITSNIIGFYNILEACRHSEGVEHFMFASSSSVYGGNTKIPFAVGDMTDRPVSLYAATKKSNELLAHAYAHLYGIHSTGLRFFTVYGPAGRPDMAYFKFADTLRAGGKISMYNIGGGKPENLLEFIDVLQGELVRAGVLPGDYDFESHRELVPMQAGDVPITKNKPESP